MDIQTLKQHLAARKRDIEAELGRLSSIYNTKALSGETKQVNPMNPPIVLSQDDRMKLLVVENERLRSMLKSMAKSAEDELKFLNSTNADWENLMGKDMNKFKVELDQVRKQVLDLQASLQVKASDCMRLSELNDILNKHLGEKDQEISQQAVKISKLKTELNSGQDQKKTKDDFDRLYREKLNSQNQQINSLREENLLLKMGTNNLKSTIDELKESTFNSQRQVDPNLLLESNAFQKGSKFYEELSSIKHEIANMTRSNGSQHLNPNINPSKDNLEKKSILYYKDKIKTIKRDNAELKEKLQVENKRLESSEAMANRLRKEKSDVMDKLSSKKAKLKLLSSHSDSRIVDSHIRNLEQQITVKKEENDKLQSERNSLVSQVDELKSQIISKNSQIEQLNNTLLKFANNFKPDSQVNLSANPPLITETPNGKAHPRGNHYKSVYKNFARIDENQEPELYFDLSLNIPPDVDQFEHENLGHFNKLKHVVRDLNEKQQQHLKNLELKNGKIKELKKANKGLNKEIEDLQKDNNIFKQSAVNAENKTKRFEEEINKYQQEKRILRNDVDEYKEKLSKADDKLEKMNKLQRENKKIEKEHEYFQRLNEEKSIEIEGLLRSLKERDEIMRQMASQNQYIQESMAQEDHSTSALFSKNSKLKKLLKRLQEDFFKLENENNTLKEAMEREISLREQMVEDFYQKAGFFESKIEIFGDFQKNLEDFKNYFANARN
jgi:chromosome segregation ATPase